MDLGLRQHRRLPAEALDDLAREAEAAIVDMVGPGRSTFARTADLRYKGQSFEITVPVGDLQSIDGLVATFHEAYERAFGHSDRETPVHVVNLRVSSARPAPEIGLAQAPMNPHVARAQGVTRLYSGGAWCDAELYDRKALSPGATLTGPAIVIQDDTTLLITTGWHAEVDGFGNIRMELA